MVNLSEDLCGGGVWRLGGHPKSVHLVRFIDPTFLEHLFFQQTQLMDSKTRAEVTSEEHVKQRNSDKGDERRKEQSFIQFKALIMQTGWGAYLKREKTTHPHYVLILGGQS